MHDMKMGYGADKSRAKLVNGLARNLSNAVVFTFKAQGHHWNVRGMQFHMFHEFFGLIYEDVQESIDPLGESMLKLGSKAPYNLVDFAKFSSLEDSAECKSPLMMLKDLGAANQIFVKDLVEAAELASQCREHGIEDFLSGRVDMHSKWQWQIGAHLADVQEAKGY